MKHNLTILLLLSLFIFPKLQGQNARPELSNSANLVFGLTQVALGGFNFETNVLYRRFAFDFSHGISLNLSNSNLSGDAQEQGLAVHIPFTSGFGVGYRFNEWLNLRVEPKWHRFELFQDGVAQTAENEILNYTTFTLGLGLYGNIRPWRKQDNWLKGWMVAPSIRYWPNITSSLDNNQAVYFNEQAGGSATHQALNIGMANTPLILNVSVGYGIGF